VEKDSGGPVIYLVDGSSYIYRAFFAIRDLKTSQGVPTNAVYGFCTMLLKVLKDFKPEFLAVVLDARGPTFRHHIYELYKANRPEMPEDLRPQVHWIMEILRALRVPVLEKEGYEADDIIGTVVEKFYAEGCRLVLISGDKDLLQLVRPGSRWWTPCTRGSTTRKQLRSVTESNRQGCPISLASWEIHPTTSLESRA